MFYAEVRTKKRLVYAKNGLLKLRYGVQKLFSSVAKIDIINDFAFKSAKKAFTAIYSQSKA